MNRWDRDSCSLLVLERGGPLPLRVPPRASSRVVVAQQPAESAEDLVARTAAQLSDLSGREIGYAVLACGESVDDGARARLADLILERLCETRRGHLVLTAKRRACTQLRWELVSIADRAFSRMAEGGGSVSIRFGDDGRA